MTIRELVKEEFELKSYGELKKQSPQLYRFFNRLEAVQKTIKPVSRERIREALR